MSALASSQHSVVDRWRLLPSWLGRTRRLFFVLLLLIIVTPPLYLSQTGGALATGYSIQRLQREKKHWQMRNQQIELELAKARSLAWVEAESVSRLGMQRPTQQMRIQMDQPLPWTARRATAAESGTGVRGPGNALPSGEGQRPAPAEPTWLDRLANVLVDVIERR